jgi:LPXTG-motif cell wall-anchored protein
VQEILQTEDLRPADQSSPTAIAGSGAQTGEELPLKRQQPHCCNTRAVRRTRDTLICLSILGALVILAPAAAIASGPGPSAGDQQYTDPLGGTTTGSHSSTPPQPASQPAPQPATPPATLTTTIGATSPASSTLASAPTTATSASSSQSAANTLPRTGLDASLAVAVGLILLAAGLALRRTARRP